MPGPMSAPNGNHILTMRRPTKGTVRTGKTEVQRSKGKATFLHRRVSLTHERVLMSRINRDDER